MTGGKVLNEELETEDVTTLVPIVAQNPKVRELVSLRESYTQHWQEMSDKEQADTLVEIRELEKAVSY